MIPLDSKLFALLRAVGVIHEVPLQALVEKMLVAAFLSKDIFGIPEQDLVNNLACLSGLDLYEFARKRKLEDGILTQERKPRRRSKSKGRRHAKQENV